MIPIKIFTYFAEIRYRKLQQKLNVRVLLIDGNV